MRVRASGQWVVDASVALKWYLRDEEYIPEADGLLEAHSSGTAILAAPHYIRYEIANGLEVASRRGRIALHQIPQRLQAFLDLNIALVSDEWDVFLSAIDIATQVSASFYDSLYLAVAQGMSYNFVTADRRLYNHVNSKLPWVVWIGNLEANL